MDGKEAIINSIISDAESRAAALVSQADNDRKESLEKSRAELERKKKEAVEAAQRDAALTVERRVSVAQLERSKTLLAAKQELLSRVYDEAITKILNMTDNIYREFTDGIIERYAENGDRVVIAERDAKRLNGEWLEKTAARLKISLTLSEEYHGGRGGIILSGKKCDKNLVLDVLANTVKGATEAKVSEKLFNGVLQQNLR